jgi:hypothetical protein
MAMRRSAIVLVLALLAAAPAAAQDAFNVPWERQLPPVGGGADVQPHPVPNCRHGRLACVKRVERRLRRQFRRLDARCDHRVIAALAYLRITQELRRDLRRPDPRFFTHRRWMAFVITDFANAYFRSFNAYARGEPVPEAWRQFYDAAEHGDTTAVHDLLLFSNAHAQHDLPFSYASMGLRTRDGRSRKTDHDGVNEINVRVIPKVKAEIERRYDPSFRDVPGPLDEMAGLEPTKSWREGAWRSAERLAAARDADEQRQVAAQIEASSAASGRMIASSPTPPGTRAARDAHCRAAHERRG